MPVRKRDDKLKTGHRGWRNARQLDADKGYLGIRYAMLHTFSHLLIRELALECGYNAASIRERIYSDADSEDPMAGVLFYTAAADSDGTLGGLVELGKPENLGRLIKQALRRATVCSSTRFARNTTPLPTGHSTVRRATPADSWPRHLVSAATAISTVRFSCPHLTARMPVSFQATYGHERSEHGGRTHRAGSPS